MFPPCCHGVREILCLHLFGQACKSVCNLWVKTQPRSTIVQWDNTGSRLMQKTLLQLRLAPDRVI